MLTFAHRGDARSIYLNKSVLLSMGDKEFQACSVTAWPSAISLLHPESICVLCNCHCMCMCRSLRQSYSSGEVWWLSAWCSTPRQHAPNPITRSWCGSCPDALQRTCTAATAAHQICPLSLRMAGVRGTQWTCTQRVFLFTTQVSFNKKCRKNFFKVWGPVASVEGSTPS